MISYNNIETIEKKQLPVRQLLLSPAKLKVLTSDATLDNNIEDKYIYRPQLPLAGYFELFIYNRLQIFGNTELFYLNSLSSKERYGRIKEFCSFPVPCVLLTSGQKFDDEILELFESNGTAVLSTEFETAKLTYIINEFLDDHFSTQATVHGSFIDVYGVGILFVGRSGIGKSEIALDLVERGHRLVADDIVMMTKKRESTLMGTGTNLVQHFVEIRGLGMIDVRKMFGIRSIRFQKRLEIVVELEDWTESSEYTRTGLEENSVSLLGVDIMHVILPIFPGKNITVIAEVIALNYLLKTYGYNAGKVFSEKLTSQIQLKSQGIANTSDRIIDYFQGDYE